MSISLNQNLKKVLIIIILFFLLGLFLFFLLFKDSFTPNKELFSTKFYTSENTEKKLSINELGFFFETKTYNLQFTTDDEKCFTYIQIPQDLGEIFAANYVEKVDFNKMFEFQKDKIIVFHTSYSNDLSKIETKQKNYSEPYLVIPEKFYTRTCR
jgi:ABC-type glycerol-3-phosphate transport system permease component